MLAESTARLTSEDIARSVNTNASRIRMITSLLQNAGLLVRSSESRALVLNRPRLLTWWFRLRRDLAERRKPVHVLLLRGWRLARQEPRRIAAWERLGCRPVSRHQCEAAIAEHIGSTAVPGNRADGIL